jgi:hypothetical protein
MSAFFNFGCNIRATIVKLIFFYRHAGSIRTPNTTWITSINENFNWQPDKDQCTLELGTGWRIPTNTEWTNVNAIGNWTNWNGPYSSALKLHAAGYLDNSAGSLNNRGSGGNYWSSVQYGVTNGWCLGFYSGAIGVSSDGSKAYGFSARCIREN